MRKFTYEYVKSIIEKEGYQLLSKEYINANTKLHLCCSKGHVYFARWRNFQQGKRCPYCAGKIKYTYEDVKSVIEYNGYKLLSGSYESRVKLKLQCSEGHNWSVRFDCFVAGTRCPYCAGNKITYEKVKQYVESQGYKLLSDYVNSQKTKLKLLCPNGHVHFIRWNNFQQGQRCPICSVLKEDKHPSWKGGVSKLNIPLYDTYADKLYPVEETRKTEEGYLEVKCSNCDKWFTPKKSNVVSRIIAINKHGGHRFYCSDSCKQACPVYGQVKYPKGFKEYSRPHQKEWADLVKSRDNYTCQICGSKNNLTAHHIEPVICDPVQSLDIDNGITLCNKCHKKIHRGCSTLPKV